DAVHLVAPYRVEHLVHVRHVQPRREDLAAELVAEDVREAVGAVLADHDLLADLDQPHRGVEPDEPQAAHDENHAAPPVARAFVSPSEVYSVSILDRRTPMLSAEDNDRLCRVGPGTSMGALLRQYWLPFAPSTELPVSDGPPKKMRLLGEDLVAFRDSRGAVGLLAEHCPHRGASLFFGRSENCGLRCVYHGWKFDATGRCVDMPSEPSESAYKDKVRAHAYPCRDVNGVLWTYMGPRAAAPPFPPFEVNTLPAEQVYPPIMMMEECNWVQALEGDIDSSHIDWVQARRRPAVKLAAHWASDHR